jgi:chromate reductase
MIAMGARDAECFYADAIGRNASPANRGRRLGRLTCRGFTRHLPNELHIVFRSKARNPSQRPQSPFCQFPGKDVVMSTTQKVAVLVGSLRKGAFSRLTANALAALAPASLHLHIVEIGQLPLYNQDDEAAPPAAWVAFRAEIKAADAVLFVTPEYNRAMPAALKNAIDVGSRPYGQSAWQGKPGAVVSVSPGALGAFGANHHLRQSMVFLDVPMMQQPEAYIGSIDKAFDAAGNLTNESMKGFLTKFMNAYAAWVKAHVAG